jgi:hypothetical protein
LKQSAKTIIAIWHSANKGKTETLRNFANLLITTYPTYKLIFSNPLPIPTIGDFQLVVQIKGKIIGIESQGDPKTNLKKKLMNLVNKFKCDIIFCSTRTKGDTVNAVNHLSSRKRFQIIWTSTYQIDVNQTLVNQIKAEHLLDLLQQLKLI